MLGHRRRRWPYIKPALDPRFVYNEQPAYIAGIDFGRQNLKSVDVRFWRLKSIPALKYLKYL